MNFMSKADLDSLRAEINAALAGVAQKHGIAIATGSCTYRETGCTFKLETAQKVEGVPGETAGEAVLRAKAVSEWNRNSRLYGLPLEGLHRSIEFAGRTYKIEGLEPRSTKFPILASRDGKLVKLTSKQVKEKLVELGLACQFEGVLS